MNEIGIGKEGLYMKMLKELKWEAILTGVLYILLGVVALVIPETMQKTLGVSDRYRADPGRCSLHDLLSASGRQR